jgi:hypothetical protein
MYFLAQKQSFNFCTKEPKYPIDHVRKWTNKKGESLLLNKSGDYFIIGAPRMISGTPVRELSKAKAMRWLKTKT